MTFLRVKRAEYHLCPWFNVHAANLIDRLLIVDPKKRIGAGGDYDELRAHKFFGDAWDVEPGSDVKSAQTAIDFQALLQERKANATKDGDDQEEDRVEISQVLTGENGDEILSTLPPLTSDERWISDLVAAAESADLGVLKGKEAHIKGIANLNARQRRLLQHMLSERKLLATPEIIRMFFESRDDAVFQRADPVERQFLGMSIFEESKFTNAFSFVFLSVPRASRPDARHDMLRRAVASVNRLWPRPRFLVLCGENNVGNSSPHSGELSLEAYRSALKLLAPNIAVVSVPGRSDFASTGGVPTPEGLQAYRNSFGADYYSFWIGRIQFIVLNSALMMMEGADTSSEMSDEIAKQAAWFEREAYIGRTRGSQVHVLCSNPVFLRKHDEDQAEKGDNGEQKSGATRLTLPFPVRSKLLETLRYSWGKYVFSSHPTRNGRGVYKGSDTSYEECDVTSVTTASLLDAETRRKVCGPISGEGDECLEGEENRTKGSDKKKASGKSPWIGGLRVVRVFESFAKPDFYRINEMPTRLDLDVVTNTAESDDEAYVPPKAQASSAASWRPEAPFAKHAALGTPVEGHKENNEDEDDDSLVIEDVTRKR